ncbi:MAG TPA: tRNA uridine-5-carboxymethylaminomethyl(34) synthesis GTPase MnmE [Flavobacteriales bacterium]|nr:tRNA uridine-5-carboxymethylaminomethyl(34) synthesis GTPase MnmE [Flavobacteriales bacterium]
MQNRSTICSLSTASSGALAIVRMSGENALTVFAHLSNAKLKSHEAKLCQLVYQNELIDEAVVTFFEKGKSFTGEDTVEITCHGSPYITQKLLEILNTCGAVPAQPGEFTMRAFLNGRMDLSQAEAVADLIASESKAAHDIAINQMRGGFSNEIKQLREELVNFASLIELELDFAEEDVEFADRKQLMELFEKINTGIEKLIASFEYGNAIKNGVPVAIVGAPNVGKSTLLNVLLNEEKAIVSNIPGTTRDVIEDTLTIEGILFRIIDTAGIRQNPDSEIEKIGIERTYEKIKQASLVLYLAVMDADWESNAETVHNAYEEAQKIQDKFPEKKVWLIGTKSDLIPKTTDALLWPHKIPLLGISAKTRQGIDALKHLMVEYVRKKEINYNTVVVTNVRHLAVLKKAHASLEAAKKGLLNQLSGDLVAMDIRATIHYLGEITGTISTEDLLGNIFSKFCIGK